MVTAPINHLIRIPYEHQKLTTAFWYQTDDISILKERAKLIKEKLEKINEQIEDLESSKVNSEAIISIDQEKCTGCARCVAYCSNKAISVNNKNIVEIDQTKCNRCGICVAECKRGAIIKINL
jgi:heterodisulfide reductase subunit A-like polyferredoxin